MKCPSCQVDNPETREFCRECGTKLVAVCFNCGFGNPPQDRFCAECATSLLEPAPSPVKISHPVTTPPPPTSFANGRYQVKKSLGDGGKNKVYFGP
jgi:ribosomal protein L40E